jgi:hypothetical protein
MALEDDIQAWRRTNPAKGWVRLVKTSAAGRAGKEILVDRDTANSYFRDAIAVPCSKRPASQVPPPSIDIDRRGFVDEFLRKCNSARPPRRLIRQHIWRAAGHKRARQFQYWQNSDPKATKSDDINFRRILRMKPGDFIALLMKQNIL